jgi:predicted ArsR family transcriptional regulator
METAKSVPPDLTLHRALADERRARIVATLDEATAPLDARELGRRVSLHPNTVRWHLGILADAGLVVSRPEPRATPGRPRVVYSLTDEGRQTPERDEYRLLATILAGTVAQSGDQDGAREAGRAWGRFLVERPTPFTHVDDEGATDSVVELLDQQGFEPTAGADEIRMHRCPFHDLAEMHPDVVCAVHEGLISGALEELGSDLRVGRLEVFPQPDVCIARLQRRAPEHENSRQRAPDL